MNLTRLILVLEDAVESLAPKYVGTFPRHTEVRRKLSEALCDLKNHREVATDEALEQADIAARSAWVSLDDSYNGRP